MKFYDRLKYEIKSIRLKILKTNSSIFSFIKNIQKSYSKIIDLNTETSNKYPIVETEIVNSVTLSYMGITCVPVSDVHIETGWLSWMNNSLITENLSATGPFTRESLSDYLSNTKSILFLACYSEEGVYFGNLRLYEIEEGVASFGRLIGEDKYRGSGYGKLLSELASSLLFDFFNYPYIIVGNDTKNLASAASKNKTGFRKLRGNELHLYLKNWNEDSDYYIKSKRKLFSNT